MFKYWLEVAFGATVGVLTAYYKKLKTKLNRTADEHKALKQAMIAMLHDSLYKSCSKYIALGYIPLEKAEEIMENLKMIYDAYHALGGNGSVTEIYKRFKRLPIKALEVEGGGSYE